MINTKQKAELELGLKNYREQREKGLETMIEGQKEMSRELLLQWIKIAYNQDTEQILFLVNQSTSYKVDIEEIKIKHEIAVDDVDRLEKYVEELVQHLRAETTDPAILEVARNYYDILSRT